MNFLAVTSDPGAWILFASLVSAALGFFTAAIMASNTLKRSRMAHWREGYQAANRDHARRRQL